MEAHTHPLEVKPDSPPDTWVRTQGQQHADDASAPQQDHNEDFADDENIGEAAQSPPVRNKPIVEHIRDFPKQVQSDVIALLGRFDKAQRQAFDSIWESNTFLRVVTGHPGTGKSEFSAIFAAIVRKVKENVLICCSSDVGVDAIMVKVEENAPELKVQRFHSLNLETKVTEALALRAQRSRDHAESSQANPSGNQPSTSREAQATKANVTEQAQPDKKSDQELGRSVYQGTLEENAAQDILDEAALNLVSYFKTVMHFTKRSIQVPHGSNAKRADIRNMGLIQRCFEAVSLPGDTRMQDIQDGPVKVFRELFHGGDWVDKPDDITLAQAIMALEAHMIQTTGFAGTTLLHSDDDLLGDNLQPAWLIIDEARAASEAETLVAISKFPKTLRHVILVGDTKQIGTPVMPARKCKECESDNIVCSDPVCKILAQLQMPLMTRLLSTGCPSIQLTTQHRMYPGLEQPSSKLFYSNHLSTGLKTREQTGAQKAMEYMRLKYNIKTEVPLFAFNLKNGISLTDAAHGPYNPHHVSFIMSLLEDLVIAGVFTPDQIKVVVAYAEQLKEIKKAFLDRQEVWKIKKMGAVWDVGIVHIDGMQGHEVDCVISDITMASMRKEKRMARILDPSRLNLLMTRAKRAHFFIGDFVAIDNLSTQSGDSIKKDSAKVDELTVLTLKEIFKHLKGLGNVVNVQIADIKERGTTHGAS